MYRKRSRTTAGIHGSLCLSVVCLVAVMSGTAQSAFVLDNDITSVATTTYSGSLFGGIGTRAFDDRLWDGGAVEEEAWRVSGTGSAYVQQNFSRNYTVSRIAVNALNAHGIGEGSGLRDFNVLSGNTEAELSFVKNFRYENANNTWQIFDLSGTPPALVWRIQPIGGTWRPDGHIYLTEIEMEGTVMPDMAKPGDFGFRLGRRLSRLNAPAGQLDRTRRRTTTGRI